MYDELIKELRDCSEIRSLSLYKRDLMKQAADAIEKLDAIAQTYAETVHELKDKHKWIPVSERLPENDCNCIVFSDEYVKEAHFYFGEFYDPVEDYMRYEATHWMPLPEPPESENVND